ncbi:DUF4352 domain-containing protein [Schaalia sp. 19OD2882]|uniref:DUF4352 domain-containing protein n=1 Tax=Schaalia sp. 19OD2882 TaxID=2794089 RepID=UPI0020A81BAF|nr:DUF4352 domain-containing protein [Schaalia sp. 19OD2882]
MALVVAVLGAILACVPGFMIIGWILLPIAFILGIVGCFQKGKAVGQAIAAIIVSIVGTIIGVVAFFAVIGAALGQVGHTEVTRSSPVTSSQEASSGQSSKDAPSGGETAETEDAAGKAGTSRENPLPIGSVLETKDWKLSVNSVNLNANEMVAQGNEFNSEPAAGKTYVVVNLTLTYIGNDPQGSTPLFLVNYVSQDGKSYLMGHTEGPAIPPEPFDQLSALFNGASSTGNLVLEVPAEGVENGVLAVQPDLVSDKTFISVK